MLFPHAKSELSSLSLILLCGRRLMSPFVGEHIVRPLQKRGISLLAAHIRIKLEEVASQPELIRFG